MAAARDIFPFRLEVPPRRGTTNSGSEYVDYGFVTIHRNLHVPGMAASGSLSSYNLTVRIYSNSDDGADYLSWADETNNEVQEIIDGLRFVGAGGRTEIDDGQVFVDVAYGRVDWEDVIKNILKGTGGPWPCLLRSGHILAR